MAEVMQVQAFAGDIGTQQDPHRVVQSPETLHPFLLLCVGHLAVQHLDLIRLQAQILAELFTQPMQGLDAL